MRLTLKGALYAVTGVGIIGSLARADFIALLIVILLCWLGSYAADKMVENKNVIW